ncbi:MAG TPA: phosphoenolpyruvate--protein phosphotransferase, partial [Chlamydiales bacterium]|nr:phosphoenolpyruvate--protein phosphotransferase [Chlamydiales bacterium]
QQYSIENEKIQGIYQELLKKTNLLSETQDQRQIKLFGNLETFQDIDFLIEQNATGIGLFRSEYLFFNHQRIPTEEEQFEVYQKIAIQLQKRPFVIRIFDLSAEKSQLDLDEMNPSLGCRGVRYLLKEKLILENQIRAVLRASAYGEIRILIPFVADLLEVLEVKKVIEEVKLELKKEKIPFNENILVGCMIEIPSAAIMADMIAKEVDFMSIGTNDLAQYTLAADRTSLYASHFFTTVHPSVLRIIKIIIEAAQKENTPLTLCGEMASDTQSLEILIGMGITAFSISPRAIPSVKYEIRKMHYEKLKGLVDQALLVR